MTAFKSGDPTTINRLYGSGSSRRRDNEERADSQTTRYFANVELDGRAGVDVRIEVLTDLRGVLICVVDVTNTPLLVPISIFNPAGGGAGFAAYQPAANAAVTQIFGRPIQFAPNCTGSQAAVAFSA